MTKVELFELIRREHRVQGKSIRQVARECRVHRRMVRQALESSVPPPRMAPQRDPPVLTRALREVIDGWLRADRSAPRKQRHTARQVWRRLRLERGFEGAESTVRRYVSRRRRDLGLSKGVYVPLSHEAGQEGEIDWYEASVDFPHGRCTVQFILMRACYSGREFHMAFPHATQQAFLEAHAAGFRWFEGVFHKLRYDNLSSAVEKVLRGRRRQETARFVAMRSHYLFESVFCTPGEKGAHEKGGVEGGLGRFRRQHLTPVPKMADFDELNRYLRDKCLEDDARRIDGRARRIADDWLGEVPHLLALPAQSFDSSEVTTQRVDSKSRVCVRTNRYSVPVHLADRRVEVRVHARDVVVTHEGREVARHPRIFGKHQQRLELDHYLELLQQKPGALAQSLPLRQAKDRGEWPEAYERMWATFRSRLGDSEGARHMLDVLMMNREHPKQEVLMAIELALEYGCHDASAIMVLFRQLTIPQSQPEPLGDLGRLARYERAQSTLGAYDQLIGAVAFSREVH